MNNLSVNRFLVDWYYSKVKYPLTHENDCKYYNESQFVYLFYNADNKKFKIGKSNNFLRRRREIQSTSGSVIYNVITLQLEPGYDETNGFIEKKLHEFFKDKREVGEWFNLKVRDVLQIRDLFYCIYGEDMTDNINELYKEKIIK